MRPEMHRHDALQAGHGCRERLPGMLQRLADGLFGGSLRGRHHAHAAPQRDVGGHQFLIHLSESGHGCQAALGGFLVGPQPIHFGITQFRHIFCAERQQPEIELAVQALVGKQVDLFGQEEGLVIGPGQFHPVIGAGDALQQRALALMLGAHRAAQAQRRVAAHGAEKHGRDLLHGVQPHGRLRIAAIGGLLDERIPPATDFLFHDRTSFRRSIRPETACRQWIAARRWYRTRQIAVRPGQPGRPCAAACRRPSAWRRRPADAC